jgi:hypothetical protein
MKKRMLLVICIGLIMCIAIAGCSSQATESESKTAEKLTSVVDQGGNEVQLPETITQGCHYPDSLGVGNVGH